MTGENGVGSHTRTIKSPPPPNDLLRIRLRQIRHEIQTEPISALHELECRREHLTGAIDVGSGIRSQQKDASGLTSYATHTNVMMQSLVIQCPIAP